MAWAIKGKIGYLTIAALKLKKSKSFSLFFNFLLIIKFYFAIKTTPNTVLA